MGSTGRAFRNENVFARNSIAWRHSSHGRWNGVMPRRSHSSTPLKKRGPAETVALRDAVRHVPGTDRQPAPAALAPLVVAVGLHQVVHGRSRRRRRGSMRTPGATFDPAVRACLDRRQSMYLTTKRGMKRLRGSLRARRCVPRKSSQPLGFFRAHPSPPLTSWKADRRIAGRSVTTAGPDCGVRALPSCKGGFARGDS